MPRLSEMKKAVRRLTVNYGSFSVTFDALLFRDDRENDAIRAKLQEYGERANRIRNDRATTEMERVKQLMAINAESKDIWEEWVLKNIRWWDICDDSDNPIPISTEGIKSADIPHELVVLMFDKATDPIVPEASASPSNAG